MNILIVSAMFPPIRTGTSFYTLNLATSLSARGNRVTVVTARNKEAEDDAKLPFRVKRLDCIHLKLRRMFKHLRFCSFLPRNYAVIRDEARALRADMILLVNHYLDIAFPAIFAARSLGTPLVVSVGTQLQSSIPWKDEILRVLDRLICGTLVFPFCSRIIAWDSEIRRYLREVHGKRILRKIDLVPYGVNGDPWLMASSRHDYSLDRQLLGVGAVIEQRDFMLLIRALKRLRTRYPQLRLKILGHVYYDAPVRLAAKLGLADAVLFAGEQPHETVVREMARSVLLWGGLSGGRYRGLGTATIEAMLCGLPVFANVPASLIGTDKARLEDMKHFVFVDGKDDVAAARRIEAILEDPVLRRHLGESGRAFILENMTWHKVAGEVEALAKTFTGTRCRP